MSDSSGIVIACDVETLESLKHLVEATADLGVVAGYKLGFSLALRFGLPACVNTVRGRTRKSVLYDHQKAGTDIPQTGALFGRVCSDAGVDAAILFPQAGPATLAAWIRGLHDHRVTPVVGALMTHPEYLVSEGGFLREDTPRAIYSLALSAGVRDFVLPATKPAAAKELYDLAVAAGVKDISAYTPGIGRQRADSAAARAAFRSFRWFPIIGSAIYEAADPASEARAFGRELALAGA